MRISVAISALKFSGCGDPDLVVNPSNIEVRIHPKPKQETTSAVVPSGGKSHVNEDDTTDASQVEVDVHIHENADAKDNEKNNGHNENTSGSREQPPEALIPPRKANGFVDLDKARVISEYMRTLSYPVLSHGQNIGQCDTDRTEIDIGGGFKQLVAAFGVPWLVSDENDIQFSAKRLSFWQLFRGYRLQEKLSGYVEGVLKLRRPRYRDGRLAFCENVVVFEEHMNFVTDEEPGIPFAARALEILKSLHGVGIIHNRVRPGFVWERDNVESLKLRDFSSAEFYVDIKSGKALPEKSVATDLESFAQQFIPPNERASFLEAINGEFSYDHWISVFKAAAGH